MSLPLFSAYRWATCSRVMNPGACVGVLVVALNAPSPGSAHDDNNQPRSAMLSPTVASSQSKTAWMSPDLFSAMLPRR